jgi:hypothetical protein
MEIEGQLTEITSTGSTPAVAPDIASASEDQLRAMIVQKQQEILNPVADPVVQAPVVPAIQEQPQGQIPTAQPQAQNEPASAPAVTFEQLQQKSGVPNPDVLAQNYANLRKEFERKSQELAQLRRAETTPQQPVTPQPQPVSDIDSMNQAFVNDLAKNPMGTIAAVVKAIAEQQTKPLYEQQKEVRLRNELMRLSSSPTTATFNLPEVQAEIQNVFKENPSYQGDMAENLETAYTLALGRLARKGTVVGQAPQRIAAAPQAGFMEGRNIPTQPLPTDPKTMPLLELERQIKQLQSQV